MPTPKEFKAKFLYHAHYHVVFKSIDGLFLFSNNSGHDLFLTRFKEFTAGFLDTWAYCLLRNHAHFIIKVRSQEDIKNHLGNIPAAYQTRAMRLFAANKMQEDDLNTVIERQFNSFMVSYVRTINNQSGKQGGLFQKPFKRIIITADAYLQQAIIYVHANAQKHGLVADFKKYMHTSYAEITKGVSFYIDSKAVLAFFKDLPAFIAVHELQVAYYYSSNWPDSKIEV